MNQTKKPLVYRHFWSISAQLALPFSLLIALVAACVIFSVTVLFYTRFSEQNNEIVLNSLELAANSVESRVNIIRGLMPVVRGEEVCTQALMQGDADSEMLQSLSELYAYGLQSTFLITTDGRVLSPAYQGTEYGKQMLEITGFNRYEKSGKDEMFSKPHGFPYLTPPEDNLYNTRISYFYALRERPDFEIYGYALVNLTLDSLFVDCETIIRSAFDQFYVISTAGDLIYSAGGREQDPQVFSYAQSLAGEGYRRFDRTHGQNTYFHRSLSSYPDWHIVAVASQDTLLQSTRLLVGSVILIGLVGILLATVVSVTVARLMTKPLQTVVTAMAAFEKGGIPDKVTVQAPGEIGQMIHGFNTMLDDIRENIDTIYREQEEKKTAEVVALRYQLQSLQNQINPHFLYNTLNVVSFLAMDHRSDEIRAFIQNFNQLLRATLSNIEDMIPLRREIALLRSYANIMVYRYPNIFEMRLDIQPELQSCMVPKLILQPLVENALLHGIFPSGRRGVITVTAMREGGFLCLIVADDGVGMDQETVDTILERPKGFTSFGVGNVNDRLRLCYGPESALVIESCKDVGTTMRFRIPMIDEEGQYE